MVRLPYGRRPAAAALALVVTLLSFTAYGANSEIVLLDFWSPQCGPCMGMKPTMHALEQASYPIREIDTTRDSQTSQQFNVHSIPCFVMLVDGREIDRKVGATSIQDLEQMFEHAKDVVVQQHRARTQSPDAGVATRPTAQGPAPQLGSNPPSGPPALARQPGSIQIPVAGAAPAPGDTGVRPTASNDFPPNLMSATVRIRVDDAQGRSFGTGTIIDSRSGEALILTCGHLFRDSKGKGPMTVEMFDVGPNGPQVSGQFPGTLISFDLERDVAFISFKPNRQVGVVPIAPDHTPISHGDRVATIGCSNGKDPTLLPQRVIELDHYLGPSNIEVSGAPEEGRSGGGLFNLQGQLIGVCYAADYEGRQGLYAGLDSVHGELDRLGLKDVYAKNGTTKPGEPLLARGQAPGDLMAMPAGTTSPTPSGAVETKSPGPQNLSPADQASFDEILKRGGSAEVVVIVRPKAPGGASEIFSLDNSSPAFVHALEACKRGPQAPLMK